MDGYLFPVLKSQVTGKGKTKNRFQVAIPDKQISYSCSMSEYRLALNKVGVDGSKYGEHSDRSGQAFPREGN